MDAFSSNIGNNLERMLVGKPWFKVLESEHNGVRGIRVYSVDIAQGAFAKSSTML
jgi:hypothetical protein